MMIRNIILCSSLVVVAGSCPAPSDPTSQPHSGASGAHPQAGAASPVAIRPLATKDGTEGSNQAQGTPKLEIERGTHQTEELPVPRFRASPSIAQVNSKLEIGRGEHKTEDLVESFASFLGWTVLNAKIAINPHWAGTVSTRRLSLAKQESIDVLSQLLFSKGIILVPLSVRDKTYELIDLSGARRNEVMSHAVVMYEAEVLGHRNRYMPVVTTFKLENFTADAAEVRTIVFPMIMAANSTQMMISTKGRSVTLHGLAPVVATAIEILRAVDKPERPAAGLEARLKGIEDRLTAIDRRGK